MLKIFKYIAILEGISTILLFFLAMPMKYLFNHPELIRPFGMAHGILFILYIIFAFLLKEERNWNKNQFVLILGASLVPLGTFYVDSKYLKIK
ncbi:DUF3817 domain-containing protein [Flavobacterium sp.]|jgi:integral membrane protein|uniref:DUF3817 domain-containing protein n=1 Tax=Flavobacterium sp. TaxID=239 RepID=UPI0037BFD332